MIKVTRNYLTQCLTEEKYKFAYNNELISFPRTYRKVYDRIQDVARILGVTVTKTWTGRIILHPTDIPVKNKYMFNVVRTFILCEDGVKGHANLTDFQQVRALESYINSYAIYLGAKDVNDYKERAERKLRPERYDRWTLDYINTYFHNLNNKKIDCVGNCHDKKPILTPF